MDLGRTFGLVLGLALLLSLACSGSEDEGQEIREPVIAADSQPLASNAPCRPRSATELLQAFALAMAEGDSEAQEQVLAPDGPFQWYSSTQGKQQFVARTVPQAISLLDERHDHGERIVIRAVSIEREPRGKIAGAGVVVTIRADDLHANKAFGRIAEGKVAIHCDRGDLMVWSVGTLARTAKLQPSIRVFCPPEKGVEVGRAIACWR